MRLALIIEYEGTEYSGFQFQENARTIQGELEKSINCLTGDFVRIKGAGRTDSGVHAKYQVIAFDSCFSDDLKVYSQGINYYLPDDIAVKFISEVSHNFDPRRDALSRVYKYSILKVLFICLADKSRICLTISFLVIFKAYYSLDLVNCIFPGGKVSDKIL